MKRIILCLLMTALVFGCFAVPAAADDTVLKTSEQGVQFIKSQEGFSAHRHWDYSQYSIGYGTACGAGDYPGGISVEQADGLLRKKLAEIEKSLNAYIIKNNLPFSVAQFDALMSFTYNVGTSWMFSSRLSKLLVSGQFTEAEFASAVGVWCHAGSRVNSGLVDRRIREIQLFLYGDYAGSNSKPYRYVIYNPNGGTVDSDIYFYPEGAAYGVLPAASKGNWSFLGWFTQDGVQLTEVDAAVENLKLTARWQSPRPADQAFSDVQQEMWFYPYVDELYNGDVISGYSDGTFRPTGTVTVGEALKLILLSCGNGTQMPLDAHWASGYRAFAVSRGYLSNQETAILDAPITRGMVAKLAAAAKGFSAQPKAGVFADTSAGYVLALYNKGIIQGTLENDQRYFYPAESITRAELSTIVCRIRSL